MSTPSAERPLRIFLVENHEDTLKWTRIYLEQLGHTVLIARTMTEALTALPAAGCDVLLSDIGLPDGNGWELLERLRLPKPIYGIAMSGFGMSADRARSKAAGYQHHILKPFAPEALEELLRKAPHQPA